VRGWLIGKFAHVRVRTFKISYVCLAAIVMHILLSTTLIICAQASQYIPNTILSRETTGEEVFGGYIIDRARNNWTCVSEHIKIAICDYRDES
jgi:hypothetical protein